MSEKIIFEHPQKHGHEECMAFDMHFHTRYSYDGLSKIDAVLAKAKREGYGVAITDHNEIQGNVRASNIGGDVPIIPGIEVTSSEGCHLLFYFYDTRTMKAFYENEIQPCKPSNPFFIQRGFADILASSHSYECVRVAPHPFGSGATGIKKHRVTKKAEKRFHAIEVINGYNTRAMNRKALRWQQNARYGLTGGSDGHTTHELGNVLTCAYAESRRAFLNRVVNGDAWVVGREENIFKKALIGVLKEETYVTKAHHERKALLLLESQFKSEVNYLRTSMRKHADRIMHAYRHFHPPSK